MLYHYKSLTILNIIILSVCVVLSSLLSPSTLEKRLPEVEHKLLAYGTAMAGFADVRFRPATPAVHFTTFPPWLRSWLDSACSPKGRGVLGEGPRAVNENLCSGLFFRI
jgi:hypothetical protein